MVVELTKSFPKAHSFLGTKYVPHAYKMLAVSSFNYFLLKSSSMVMVLPLPTLLIVYAC